MGRKGFPKRTKAREYAFQMIYRYIMTEETIERIPETFWANLDGISEEVKEYAYRLLRGAVRKMEVHDELIVKYLKHDWTFDRLGEVEKNMLRLAMFELFQGETPYYAVIDDFVTLTKKFSDDKAASLVNGILESLRKDYGIAEEGNEDS